MARKLGTVEFKRDIAEHVAARRAMVEAQVSGLDPSPKAIAERRKKALDSFEYFARTYLPHYIKKPNSKLHDFLYKRLPEIVASPESELDVVEAPRGEAKSTICDTAFPLWCIVKSAKHYILIIMDVEEQAALMLADIKVELEVNPRLLMDFPEICGKSRVWRDGVIVTKNRVKVHARGAGQRVRGLRHGPHRPDLGILDDLENDLNVRSLEYRDRIDAWIDAAVLNLGGPGEKFDVLYIGSVLHHDAVIARKARNAVWRAAKFQSVIRWPDRMDLWDRWEEVLRNDGKEAAAAYFAERRQEMLKGSEVSWPGGRPFDALMLIRARDATHAAFDKEHQNDPSSENATFKKFTFWVNRLGEWAFAGSCDPSLGGKNKKNDPSAILVGGFIRSSGMLDVVEASIRRRVPNIIIEDIIRLQKEYRCLRWFTSEVAFEKFFKQVLMERALERHIPVPAVGVPQIVDKELRIEFIEPYVTAGKIRFNPNHATLLEQLRHYGETDHDDGPDALEMLWTGCHAMLGSNELRSSGEHRAGVGLGDFLGNTGGGRRGGRGSSRRDLTGFM